MYTKTDAQFTKAITWMSYFILGVFLSSCSDAKLAARSYSRFKKHGGMVDCYNMPLITDNDSIYSILGEFKGLRKNLYPCICPDVKLPTPKYVYRFDNRRFNDSLRWIKRMASDSLSAAKKQAAIKAKHDEKMYKLESARSKVLQKENRKLQVQLKKAKHNWKFWFSMGALSMLLGLVAFKRIKRMIPPPPPWKV